MASRKHTALAVCIPISQFATMTSTVGQPPSHEALRECPDCGLFQVVPRLAADAEASCPRCDKVLRRTRPQSNNRALALTLTSFVLYLIAVWSPFLSADILGQTRETTMISLPTAFVADGAWELGLVVLMTIIVMPLCKIVIVLVVLLGLRVASPPRWLATLFRWYQHIGPWAMVEVFLLGVFVAFTRLGAIATVQIGTALYALGALLLTMVLADCVIDRQGIWEEMEEIGLVSGGGAISLAVPVIGCENCGLLNEARSSGHCLRCGTRLHRRRPNSIARTWALLGTAALFYLPANIYPVLTITQLGVSSPSTILGGAKELLQAGMWPLALLVFVASVLVPGGKLVGLSFMLIEIHLHSSWRLHDRTRLYRVIEFIGRWSMIDVFMLATLVGLVRSGEIASIDPGFGAICFATVVILTMLAALCFDPRLMWDAAERRPARPARQMSPSRSVAAQGEAG
jgi:paraquat-inducible protein A